MMKIKGNGMTRTSTYLCTLSRHGAEEKIATIRDVITKQNLLNRDWAMRNQLTGAPKRIRLVIRPRLGKDSPFKHLYARGGPLYRTSSQTIKREHGSRFDLYLRSTNG